MVCGEAYLDDRLGKMAQWNLHDIRRGVATWLAENNIEPHVIEAILNHYSGHRGGVAGIYNRAKYARQDSDCAGPMGRSRSLAYRRRRAEDRAAARVDEADQLFFARHACCDGHPVPAARKINAQ